MCLQSEAAPLEGLARSGSQACLTALRECLPARKLLPRSVSSLALVQPLPPALPLGDAAAYQRLAALQERSRSLPFIQGLHDPAARRGPAGAAAGAKPESAQPGWSTPAHAGGSSSSSRNAADAASPAKGPATPHGGPGERLERPAWLDEAARRVSQGIHLGGRASLKGSSSPGVSFPESLPAAFATLGVASRNAV